MKLRDLESLLQDVRTFDCPKVQLEQYPTRPHLAAHMVYTIDTTFESFEENVVADLGCGTGVLGIGCALLGCPHVIAVDVDPDGLSIAQQNTEAFDTSLPIDFVCMDVGVLDSRQQVACDVVVMNPPFGTKTKNADRVFLNSAFRIAEKAVFSLHKTSTRPFIEKLASKADRVDHAQVVAQMRYDLPASYSFHKSVV